MFSAFLKSCFTAFMSLCDEEPPSSEPAPPLAPCLLLQLPAFPSCSSLSGPAMFSALCLPGHTSYPVSTLAIRDQLQPYIPDSPFHLDPASPSALQAALCFVRSDSRVTRPDSRCPTRSHGRLFLPSHHHPSISYGPAPPWLSLGLFLRRCWCL